MGGESRTEGGTGGGGSHGGGSGDGGGDVIDVTGDEGIVVL